MSKAELLISMLESCRQSGPGKWIARCPAHDDKSPSLSIMDGDDGKALLHCFAGCESSDVVAAIGLSMSDLFPDTAKPCDSAVITKRKHGAMREILSDEQFYAAIFDADIAKGKSVTHQEVARSSLAKHRIWKTERMLMNV